MTSNFFYQEIKGMGVYQTSLFQQTGLVKHGFTARIGGVSPLPYQSLNLAFHTGDLDQNVLQNRRLLSSALELDLASWVAGKQIHGDRVAVIGRKEIGKGAYDYASALEDADALITDIPGVVLTSYSADCVPILFLDPKKKAIGAVHAGWRGTVEKIGVKTLGKMQEFFGSESADCLIAIGPSIGPLAFQVDEKVLFCWQNTFPYWEQVSQSQGEGKWLLDLWETNKRQLLEVGVREENITVSRLCTFCRTDLFFSYRAQKGKTGRMAALLSLN